jgi:YesN/AraC family two-component response regulator
MNERLKMAWIDLTVSSKGRNTLPIGMETYFEICRFEGNTCIDKVISENSPAVIAFDFDYPDLDSIGLMVASKKANPSLPMIMITLQHSEKLAVWVFRSRMADYLVKPVPQHDIERCYKALAQMTSARAAQDSRTLTSTDIQVPLEVAAHVVTAESAFLPAIYYVAQHFDEKIQNSKLCAMSPFRFSRGFKEAFGIAFRDYVVRYRLRQAHILLKNPNVTITDVAFSVGFSEVSYFSRMFKKYFGVSPSKRFGPKSSISAQDISPTAELEIPVDLLRDVVA